MVAGMIKIAYRPIAHLSKTTRVCGFSKRRYTFEVIAVSRLLSSAVSIAIIAFVSFSATLSDDGGGYAFLEGVD